MQRRKFIKAAAIAAVALIATPTQAQSWKQRDGNPDAVTAPPLDLLAYCSKDTFTPYVGSTFHGAGTLVSVDDMQAPAFALVFDGGTDEPKRQDVYDVTHPALGAVRLLLVPDPDNYVAVINRL